ncbi:MAG: hypothetical protein WC942_01265 [Clostridia bacterium]|jgi:hypothetical protein
MENSKPTIGIRKWGTMPKKERSYGDEDIPRIPFMKLEKGINDVRIVTDFGVYYQARWKGPSSKRAYGDRIRTAYPTYDDCPVKNDLGIQPKERYIVIVIDRKDDELKLLDLSPLVQEQIETNLEVKNKRRPEGNKITPRDFDISIKFDPSAKKATGFYSVVAADTEPMLDSDLNIIKNIGGEEMLNKILSKQLICPKRETVIKKLKEIGWDGTPTVEENKDNALQEPSDEDYSFQRPAEAEEAVVENETAAAVNE